MSILEDQANKKSKIHSNVYLLGWVSLFTDLSSQMIYPLVPIYLQNLGASALIIGTIEGISESVASLFKIVFGKISDRLNRRKIFVYAGYGLSALSKPLLYLVSSWPLVLILRVSDRMGKAIRNPARDALISLSIDHRIRGRAFGIHRGMDRIGAAGGAILASLVLWFTNDSIQLVFLFAGIPAILALVFIPFTREFLAQKKDIAQPLAVSGKRFKFFILSMVIFTLGNSSNAFLILKASETGISLAMIPILWLVYNLVASVSSPLLGSLSDKWGRKLMIQVSFIFYAFVYAGFAFASSNIVLWLLFAVYGIYYGLSNGIFRAYIADQTRESNRGSAYGIFQTGTGLALLPASMIMGFVWDLYGSQFAFMISVLFSLAGFFIFIITQRGNENT